MSWRTWSYFSSSKTAKLASQNFYKKFRRYTFVKIFPNSISAELAFYLPLYWIDVSTTQDGSLITAIRPRKPQLFLIPKNRRAKQPPSSVKPASDPSRSEPLASLRLAERHYHPAIPSKSFRKRNLLVFHL